MIGNDKEEKRWLLKLGIFILSCLAIMSFYRLLELMKIDSSEEFIRQELLFLFFIAVLFISALFSLFRNK